MSNTRPLTKRAKTNDLVEVTVLTASQRRCCLCYFLEGDTSQKKGQLAHLDRDPRNSKESNLVFLCLNHHNEYDSTAYQSKGFTRLEVAQYRERLYQVLQGVRSTTPVLLVPLSRHDSSLISDFRKIFPPSSPTFRFLEKHDIANAFPRSHMLPLYEYEARWRTADFEFDDPCLELGRIAFDKACREFMAALSLEIAPARFNSDYYSIDFNDFETRPDRWKTVHELNSLATSVFTRAQELIRLFRARAATPKS